jgi:hypothetical protein
MTILFNFDKSNTHTLQSIEELYTTHFDINRLYHFQYKTEESATNFGDLSLSFLDKSTHHTILNVESSSVSENKKNLFIKPNKTETLVIAYTYIPKNYQFDIISSPLDGKTLVIYDKHIKKSNSNTEKSNIIQI